MTFRLADDFPVRLQTVAVTEARDYGGVNERTAPEPAPPPPPSARADFDRLCLRVQRLVDADRLLPEAGGALLAKLDAALAALAAGDPATARTKLQDFINQVNAFVQTGRLTTAQGQPLTDAASDIIALP